MRYCVVRYPDPGLPALAGEPNDFSSREEAQKRIDEIEGKHLKSHHTSLGIISYEGPRGIALRELGVLE